MTGNIHMGFVGIPLTIQGDTPSRAMNASIFMRRVAGPGYKAGPAASISRLSRHLNDPTGNTFACRTSIS